MLCATRWRARSRAPRATSTSSPPSRSASPRRRAKRRRRQTTRRRFARFLRDGAFEGSRVRRDARAASEKRIDAVVTENAALRDLLASKLTKEDAEAVAADLAARVARCGEAAEAAEAAAAAHAARWARDVARIKESVAEAKSAVARGTAELERRIDAHERADGERGERVERELREHVVECVADLDAVAARARRRLKSGGARRTRRFAARRFSVRGTTSEKTRLRRSRKRKAAGRRRGRRTARGTETRPRRRRKRTEKARSRRFRTLSVRRILPPRRRKPKRPKRFPGRPPPSARGRARRRAPVRPGSRADPNVRARKL